MKYTNNRFAALTLAVTMGAGFVTMPFAAHASEEGRRNTAIGLGVAAAALLLTQKNKVPGAIVAAGAVVAATQIGSDHDRYRRDRDYGYDNRDYNNRYNSGYRNNDSYRNNEGYGYNDNRRYHEDVRNNHDQYSRDQYNNNRDRNYNDGQSGYRVGDNSARYHEQGSGREARKAR